MSRPDLEDPRYTAPVSVPVPLINKVKDVTSIASRAFALYGHWDHAAVVKIKPRLALSIFEEALQHVSAASTLAEQAMRTAGFTDEEIHEEILWATEALHAAARRSPLDASMPSASMPSLPHAHDGGASQPAAGFAAGSARADSAVSVSASPFPVPSAQSPVPRSLSQVPSPPALSSSTSERT